MEMNRYYFAKLVEASECFFRIDDAMNYLTRTGITGKAVLRIENVLVVTRAFSVYADDPDLMDDDIRYLKFKAVVTSDKLSLDEKVDILTGSVEDPLKDAADRRGNFSLGSKCTVEQLIEDDVL